MIGSKRIECASSRWKKSYEKSSVLGLDDSRFNNSGRPRVHELTIEETLAKKDAEIEYSKT
ncbi:hypothetical protein [Terrisporobacter sp.]|uniref:hypothetical protein n=1 Tax=Terrisporobacter sp. TaxID=1965305 RepID=UPI003FCD852A